MEISRVAVCNFVRGLGLNPDNIRSIRFGEDNVTIEYLRTYSDGGYVYALGDGEDIVHTVTYNYDIEEV